MGSVSRKQSIIKVSFVKGKAIKFSCQYMYICSFFGVPYLKKPKQSPLNGLHALLLPLDTCPSNGKCSRRNVGPVRKLIEIKQA